MTTATTIPTTETTTKEYYNKRVYVPKGEWNSEAVLIRDQIDKFRPMWVPRSEIKEARLLDKRDFEGKVDFIYTLEIEANWWHKNVQFKGQVFTGNNGHRRGWKSDD